MIVADTNLLVYFLLPGEHTEAADAVFDADSAWCAPLLWRSEFRNVLSVYIRTGCLERSRALVAFEQAELCVEGREFDVLTEPVLKLAEESGCSAYDCEFVALARELDRPLITSDPQLLTEFPQTAISMDEFPGGPAA